MSEYGICKKYKQEQKEKLFTGLCLLVRLITWGVLLLVVIAIAIPMMLLELLVDALKGNE